MTRKSTQNSTDLTSPQSGAREEVHFASPRDEWFVERVLPLEPALMRFLRRHWRNTDELTDLRQEIYVRLYESVEGDNFPTQTRAYVYTCARNLLIDRARHASVVSIESFSDLEESLHPADDFSPERVASARGELKLLQGALDDLSPRCREVVVLRKVEGLSQREIADRMGIAEGTVEKQITLGIRSIAESLFAQGVERAAQWVARRRRQEDDA